MNETDSIGGLPKNIETNNIVKLKHALQLGKRHTGHWGGGLGKFSPPKPT